jgi:enoyl-CoA hydratase
MPYKTLIVEPRDRVRLIRFNRPEALNAFNDELMDELTAALADAETEEGVGCIVITGSDKAFAAGADIKAIAGKTYAEVLGEDLITRNWEAAARCTKPVIAAVAGYALGGGCEMAMMCDFIIAADNAKFGQPELKIGVSPGAGGTQRLPRFIGKAKAMDMVLTGRLMDASEAERCGLVSRVTPLADLLRTAIEAGNTIAALPPNVVRLSKELVNAAFETPLAQGVLLERRLFHSMFAFEDQKEGMAAFVEKRAPHFRGR